MRQPITRSPVSPEVSPDVRSMRPLVLCLVPSGLFLVAGFVFRVATTTTGNQYLVLTAIAGGLAVVCGILMRRLRWGPTDGWDDLGLNGAFLWRRGHRLLGLLATVINVTALVVLLSWIVRIWRG